MERRFSVDVAKSHGVHYTPDELAQFVARRVAAQLGDEEVVILDPACGDGALLSAIAAVMADAGQPPPHLIGVDHDQAAIEAATQMLRGSRTASLDLHYGDFLDTAGGLGRMPQPIDVVISNPPYVRTQVLGAARAQELARQFGLRGRVDLYHAFVAAMTERLVAGGVLGLLCSNRFMTTKGGHSLRELLARNYEISEIWDLGDTKLFDAAVLPALLLGRKSANPSDRGAKFVRVYETDEPAEASGHQSLLVPLEEGTVDGTIQVADRRFKIERGELADRDPGRPWRLTSSRGGQWLAKVKRRASGRLADLGPIRVGIKTTADGVFVRDSWDELPTEIRPEDDLLLPLLTHHVAGRWIADASKMGRKAVLYTHEHRDGKRRAINLADFPRAAAYLELHRDRLEGRSYVREAGREWFEIWVPQQPSAWAAPKLVWPDISEQPRFFLDESGAVVNGDCYWLTCPGQSPEEIALALAVANSSFAIKYYDMCCGNRLYAGRRRFITQYLEDLPLPHVTSAELDDISAMVNTLRQPAGQRGEDRDAVERALDDAVTELFEGKKLAR